MEKHWLKLGFTLIEILCVLIIIWIIVGFSTIKVKDSQKKARDMIRKNDLQMIADALISYANDHGHFPSSIYDENIPGQEALTISQVLNKITDWWEYMIDTSQPWKPLIYKPNADRLWNILDGKYIKTTTKWSESSQNEGWSSSSEKKEVDTETLLNDAAKRGTDASTKQVAASIDYAENNMPIGTDANISNWDFAIITQWMCMQSLETYLVDNWYLAKIPNDPSWESVNIQTNICGEWHINWTNANDHTIWNIQECLSAWSEWCAKLCGEWYMYASDWNHFALIAHMESKNGWNYETTACGSCEAAWRCKWTNNKPTSREKTDQLPCDIIDEFTNTFDCIQNTWVVEYNTWEYYFYIY